MQSDILDRIEAADLTPAVFRTAIRLARLTATGAHVLLNYEEVAAICGTTSDNTVRGHLGALHRAGLFDYKRNRAVTVWWIGAAERSLGAPSDGTAYSRPQINLIAERSNRSVDDQQPCDDDTAQRSVCDCAERTLCDQIDRTQINLIAHRSDGTTDGPDPDENPVQRSVCDQIDRPQINLIAGGSNRSVGDQPNTGLTTGRQAGLDLDLPACLPEGGVGETATDGMDDQAAGTDADAISASDAARSIALLTDPEIGWDLAGAGAIASKHPFEEVRAHVFRARRDMAAGKISSFGAIKLRLARGFGASIVDADRASSLWRRHTTLEDEEAERRRKYIPDEYADFIVG